MVVADRRLVVFVYIAQVDDVIVTVSIAWFAKEGHNSLLAGVQRFQTLIDVRRR
jgi:hypothetical protein